MWDGIGYFGQEESVIGCGYSGENYRILGKERCELEVIASSLRSRIVVA